jgi:hypothetical protein
VHSLLSCMTAVQCEIEARLEQAGDLEHSISMRKMCPEGYI